MHRAGPPPRNGGRRRFQSLISSRTGMTVPETRRTPLLTPPIPPLQSPSKSASKHSHLNPIRIRRKKKKTFPGGFSTKVFFSESCHDFWHLPHSERLLGVRGKEKDGSSLIIGLGSLSGYLLCCVYVLQNRIYTSNFAAVMWRL